jgi:hypothetical protein
MSYRVALHRYFGERVHQKPYSLSTIALSVRHWYRLAIAKHEKLDFSPDGRWLVATIEGYPDWVVRVSLLETDSGPAIAELQVRPWQQHYAQKSKKGWQRYWVRRDGTTTPIKSAPLAEAGDWSGEPSDLPPGGIPARLIRSINAGELLSLVRRCARDEQLTMNEGADRVSERDPAWAAYMRDIAAASETLTGEPKRRGRLGNGIDHYLTWAVRYSEKVSAGETHPIAALASEHGETRNYVRDTITDARRRHGLLTYPGQGRAGGVLSEKALDLLATRQRKQGART